MPPWVEYDQLSTFDRFDIANRRDLHGDEIALKYHQEWVEGKNYPLIHFPSEVEREIIPGGEAGDGPQIHIFGGLAVPFNHSRDKAYDHIIPAAQEHGLILSKEHDRRLRIANPETGRSYLLTFDNAAGHLSNIELFPQYAMDLMPGEIRAVLPPLYSQELKGMEAVAPVKYFTPDSSWSWYASEFDGEDLMFGMVSGYEVELGYFRLSELESVRGPLQLPIERDLYFQAQTLKDLQAYERRLKP